MFHKASCFLKAIMDGTISTYKEWNDITLLFKLSYNNHNIALYNLRMISMILVLFILLSKQKNCHLLRIMAYLVASTVGY